MNREGKVLMNREAIEKVLAAIKKAPARKFHMDHFFADKYNDNYYSISQDKFDPYKCNTAACIAGWTAFVYKTCHTEAKHVLGLSDQQALLLFYGMPDFTVNPKISKLSQTKQKKAAIEVLEYLLKTGKVDWNRALKKHG